MNILILGGTGFIGRNAIEYFADKDGVNIRASYNKKKGISNKKNVKWVYCDLREPNSYVGLFDKIDVVLQFAATTSGVKDIIQKPYIHVTDNAVMNSYALRYAYESGVKHFIFPSCTVMMDSVEKQSENDWNPAIPINEKYYGVANTKIYIETMCKFYGGLGMKTTAIRHSNIYGPYDKFDLEKSHVMGATIRKVINAQENEIIEIWGSGKAKRDLLYVKDLMKFVDKAIKNQKEKFELFNCGYGESISINELVRKIIEISDKKLGTQNNLEKPDIPTALSLECSYAKKRIGWERSTNIYDGIKKTYEWAENQINAGGE